MRKEGIDIIAVNVSAKEWFDRLAGNSYFSGIVSFSYKKDGILLHHEYYMPFQYGYGSAYLQEAAAVLKKAGIKDSDDALWKWCQDNGMVFTYNLQDKCLKRSVIAYGKGE